MDDCYHVGLVVPHINTATTRLTAASGCRWTKPIEATLQITAATVEYDYVESTGVRIELVDRALFPNWLGFLEMMKA
jgi:transposase